MRSTWSVLPVHVVVRFGLAVLIAAAVVLGGGLALAPPASATPRAGTLAVSAVAPMTATHVHRADNSAPTPAPNPVNQQQQQQTRADAKTKLVMIVAIVVLGVIVFFGHRTQSRHRIKLKNLQNAKG